jgi:xylem cysteine proteinase
MRQYAITLSVVGIAAAVAVFAVNQNSQPTALYQAFTQEDVQFMKYVSEFAKSYGTKEEFEFRSQQFKENFASIMKSNAQNSVTYQLGLNEFADYTAEEYKRLLGLRVPERRVQAESEEEEFVGASTYIDWRQKGAVNAVKNQGSCGSCWAFSAIAALEGHHAINNAKLENFSEQHIVDCSKNGNAGCNGGWMDNAFEYAKTHGLIRQANYPYTGRDGTCQESGKPTVVTVQSYTDIPEGNQAALAAAIAKQPVSVAVHAGGLPFQFYKNGILDGAACGNALDHGIAAVGYGVENGKEYFIVRNSWGASWGESGYIRIARNDSVQGGVCGIALAASYPTVKKI